MNKDLKALKRAIKLWNDSRLDLFEISEPDKNFEFHGVIRFYHQDSAKDGKYATKCVRVSSSATTVDVIDTLSEKFRSDMRMLTKPNYGLYEVHVNGEARKLKDNENPLIVQLGWLKEDQEGRFLLRNEDDKRPVHVGNGLYEDSEDTIKGIKVTRNLTKKEKKQKKKKDKNQKNKDDAVMDSQLSEEVSLPNAVSAAKQLYTQVPESTFTRTVSNPEAVMKKRREQKLQKRGAELLKVYGDSIKREIPYKTLLLLPTDNTDQVIRDALDKYGLGKESTSDYVIVQVVLPPGSKPEECMEGGWGKEIILDTEDCPLDIEQKWQPHQGTLLFQLRPCAPGYAARKKRKTPSQSQEQADDRPSSARTSKPRKPSASETAEKQTDRDKGLRPSKRPKLIEVLAGNKIRTHDVAPNVTEIGGDHHNAAYRPFIELHRAPGLMPAHCVITNMDGIVTVTPHDGVGEVYVDGRLIEETTMLSHGSVVYLGKNKQTVFCDAGKDIPFSDVQKRIKALAPREQTNRNYSRSSSQNIPASLQRREGLGSNLSSDRPRHHSATSTSSSKSGSVGRAPVSVQDRTRMPPNVQMQAKSQPRLPPAKPSSEDLYYQRSSAPPQTATVQPIQQRGFNRLPASIRVIQDSEESLVSEIFSVRANSLHFKLSPAYSVYLMERNFVEESRHKIVPHLELVTDLLEQKIQMNSTSVSELSFWMANTSELLNFIRQDHDLTNYTIEIQDTFAKTVQLSFRHLVQCMQRTLFDLMPAFLSESDADLPGGDAVDLKKQNQDNDDPTMYNILQMLASVMSLLRRCRVNAALTIQLFSQLFHSINMWLFNKLVASAEARRLCCREWGMRIRARLAMVETWAEKQGLELAADCHLARITQATHLLQAPKQTADDIAAICGTCFKLNSLQLRSLLSNYEPHERDGERRISQDLIDQVVAVAENSADELTRSDGRDVRLKEDPDLQLPFLLPEDGYSCDVVHGVPSGLTEFIEPFVREGFCTYHVDSNASDRWTVHFQSHQHPTGALKPSSAFLDRADLPREPEIVTITINKRGGGMGLSIVAARGVGQERLGIYIRSVVQDGASDLDGRLQAGDQLLSVDGQSLIGVDQAKAAELMTRTGPTVTLRVAKQGAVYHGLATLLSQPSPKQPRANLAQRRGNAQHAQSRPKSEGHALYANSKQPFRNTQNFSSHNPTYEIPGKPFPAKYASNLNQSTPQLSENRLNEPSPQRISSNTPRSAISVGNLQHSGVESRDNRWNRNEPQRDWLKKNEPPYKAESPGIVNTRRKATSQTALSSLPANDSSYAGRYESQSNDTSNRSHLHKDIPSPAFPSPRDGLPSPPSSQPSSARSGKYSQNSLDNPNYDHFPSPPPELQGLEAAEVAKSHFKPVKAESPRSVPDAVKQIKAASPVITATQSSQPSRRGVISPPAKRETPTKDRDQPKTPPSSKKSQTLGRPGSGKKPEVARVTPTQKKQAAQASNKSSTLPRHFKSISPWERDEREKKEQSIQEQLNALRDEEIEELSTRTDLTPLENDRLKSLLQERDFQARVQEEKMRMFSDEDISEEDYSVPDRPDRDRLIRLEGAHAQRDAAMRQTSSDQEEKNQLLWEEEQRRKKEEADIRAKQEAERREERRRDRERAERERQEEKRRYEEEQARITEEREREAAWMNNYKSLQREEEEQRRKLDELRRIREEEENQLQKLQKQKQANAREEAERQYLEEKLSAGKPGSFTGSYKKYAPVSSYSPRSPALSTPPSGGQPGRNAFFRTSTSTAPSSATNRNLPEYSNRPVMREHRSVAPRPVSDGYALGKNDWLADEELPPRPTTPPSSTYGGRRPISYVSTSNTPKVIGAQELYNDPRSRREANLKKEQSFKRRGPDPSRLTFKDRQRMFQEGRSSPVAKPKSSRKLMEIEESLRGQM